MVLTFYSFIYLPKVFYKMFNRFFFNLCMFSTCIATGFILVFPMLSNIFRWELLYTGFSFWCGLCILLALQCYSYNNGISSCWTFIFLQFYIGYPFPLILYSGISLLHSLVLSTIVLYFNIQILIGL